MLWFHNSTINQGRPYWRRAVGKQLRQT